MDELAIFGGCPAVRIATPRRHVLSQRAVEGLHQAVERARTESAYISALSGAGPVAEFEAAVREHLQVRYALAVSSGTTSIFLALAASGIKEGDEVIVPAYTWPQTVAPVLHLGAKPVFADIDARRYTISPASVRDRLTDRTAAIIAVHIYGQPADMSALREIARDRRIKLLEDAAQAFGARCDGHPVGCFGDIACFSLGSDKPLSGGEGGLLVTNNRRIYEQAIALSQHPLRRHFETTLPGILGDFGYNFRIHPLACVIALAEIEKVAEEQQKRANFYSRLSAEIAGIPGVRPPDVARNAAHAFWRYCPTFVPDKTAMGKVRRSRYIEALVAEGVPLYPDAVGISLEERLHGRTNLLCPISAERCRRSGLTLAPWVVEEPDIVSDLRFAFEKVAVEIDQLYDRPGHGGRKFRVGTRRGLQRQNDTGTVAANTRTSLTIPIVGRR